MFGGLSREVLNDTVLIDPVRLKWIPTVIRSTDGYNINRRFAHSAVEHKKKLVVFGGEYEYSKVTEQHVCLNDVSIFTPETMEWKYFKTYGIIETRRYHVAAMIGKHMIVHGGLNSFSHVLSDFWALNMDTGEWN